MVKVVAKNYINPGMEDGFTKLAEKLVKATVELDEGCIKYELFQDMQDSTVMTIIEEWENMELLNKHMQAPHFAEIIPQFENFMSKPMEINVYQKVL